MIYMHFLIGTSRRTKNGYGGNTRVLKMHIDELRQAQRKGRDCTSVQISAA